MAVSLSIQITELKAQLYEMEKEYRIKQQTFQKQHTESLDALQVKTKTRRRQYIYKAGEDNTFKKWERAIYS